MNRARPGIVARVLTRMEVHFLEARGAGAPQSLFARAGRNDGQTEHTHHPGRLYPAETRSPSGARVFRPGRPIPRRPALRCRPTRRPNEVARLSRLSAP